MIIFSAQGDITLPALNRRADTDGLQTVESTGPTPPPRPTVIMENPQAGQIQGQRGDTSIKVEAETEVGLFSIKHSDSVLTIRFRWCNFEIIICLFLRHHP